MGIIQKDALRTSIISYVGLILGYVNKGILFVLLLKTEEIGIVNLILTVSVLFSQFANFGTFNAIWRFFPNLRNDTNGHNGFLAFNLKIALVGILAISLLLIVFRDPIGAYYAKNSESFIDYFVWIIPTGIAVLLFKLLDGFTRALYKSVYAIFVNEFLLRLITTIILTLYFFQLFDFDFLVLLLCLAQWIPGILLIFYLVKLGEWKVAPKRVRIHRKMRNIIYNYSAYSYLNSIGSSIIVTIDALMVASMLGLSETGIYTTIIFVSRALTIPYGAIMRIAIPIIPGYWKENAMKKMNDLYVMVSSVSLALGLFFFAGVWISRVELFNILPPEFEQGIDIFLFIMIGKLFDMFCGLNTTILITSKKFRYDMIFTGALVILVILLNLWMIPIYGMVGAATSSAIAYIIYNSMRVIFVWWNYGLLPFSKSNIYIMILFSVILLFFEFTDITILNKWFTIGFNSILLTAVFWGVVYLLKLDSSIVNYMDKILIQFRLKKA